MKSKTKTKSSDRAIQNPECMADRIIRCYPELGKEKSKLMDILCDTDDAVPTYVLERFTYAEKFYYRDPYGSIVNPDAKIVGAYKKKDMEYVYYFLDDSIHHP